MQASISDVIQMLKNNQLSMREMSQLLKCHESAIEFIAETYLDSIKLGLAGDVSEEEREEQLNNARNVKKGLRDAKSKDY